MRHCLRFLLLGLAVMLGACSKDNPVDPQPTPTPTPTDPALTDPAVPAVRSLTLGSRWTTRETYYYEDGSEDLSQFLVETVTVVGDTMIAGERWAKMSVAAQDQSSNYSYRFLETNRSDGRWIRSITDLTRAPVFKGLPTVKLGQTIDLTPLSHLKLLSMTANMTVLAGQFKAREYLLTEDYADPLLKYYYLVPKVGLIKEAWYQKFGTQSILRRKVELTEVHLAGGN